MLQYHRRNCPQTRRIVTDNAVSDAAVLAVIRRVGFKEYKTYGFIRSPHRSWRKLGAVRQVR
jgi:hypothetical protein